MIEHSANKDLKNDKKETPLDVAQKTLQQALKFKDEKSINRLNEIIKLLELSQNADSSLQPVIQLLQSLKGKLVDLLRHVALLHGK